MQAFVERWIGSIERECLDYFVPLGEEHLNLLVREYVAHHNDERPPRNRQCAARWSTNVPNDIPTLKFVGCKKRLGGLLRHYHRKAA